MPYDFTEEGGFDSFDPENPNEEIMPGKYCILIQSVDDSDPEKSIVVDYEVLSGTTPGQEGRTGREYLARSPKAAIRIALFAMATGLVTQQQLIDAKKGKKKLKPIEFEHAEGKVICVEIHKQKDRDYPSWKFRSIWGVDDEAAKDIPKSEWAMAQNGAGNGDGLGEIGF